MDAAAGVGPTGDPEGQQAWENAARRCAARVLDERGVADGWSVTEEDGVVWVNYDMLRVRVGVDTRVTTAAQLLEELDLWVANDRPAGPGRWLPRDEAAVRSAAPEIKILMHASDGSGSGHTASLWEVEDEEDAVYELVDLFEDDLVEEVWGKWPACPTHDRLLRLDRVDGAATWVCPQGNRPLARIGSLTKSSHEQSADG